MKSIATVVGLVCGFAVGGCGGTDESIIGTQELASTQSDSSKLRSAVGVSGITSHLQALEDNGPRPSGSPAYDSAFAYFEGKLAAAGYKIIVQPFDFFEYTELAPSTLSQTSPNAKVYASGTAAYELGTDVGYMEYSPAGTVAALVQPTSDIVIPPGPTAGSSNSGCEPADFPSGTAGKIALVQRGTCTFLQKVQNAAAAGAVGVILFNEGQPERSAPEYFTLGEPGAIPVLMVSYAVGAELYGLALNGAVSVTMTVSSTTHLNQTKNLIAESVGGRPDRVVVAGAHLDSAVGAGVNDNGSGAATLLTIAEQLTALNIAPRNKLRFAFWGAEENGLIGSERYASQLSAAELKQHQVYLNFDMLASANYALMVYDGDASEGVEGWTSGPNGSGNVETILKDYFSAQQMTTFATGLDGRSDYLGFADRKIPVGGLFTGADEIKTAEQAALYGGTAGVLLDPNYHTADDTLANANKEALDIMSDATAHAVLTFAMTTSAVTGTSQSSAKATKPPTYKGPHKIR